MKSINIEHGFKPIKSDISIAQAKAARFVIAGLLAVAVTAKFYFLYLQ